MMLKKMRELTAGVLALHPVWWMWMAALILVNGVAPLFFLPRLTAVVTLVASMASFLLGLVLVRVHGFTKLLGLMHAPWVPMLVALIYLYPGADTTSAYKVWLIASIALTIGSLAIDVTDVCRFLKKAIRRSVSTTKNPFFRNLALRAVSCRRYSSTSNRPIPRLTTA